jgi:hypothetical protein
VAPALQYLGTSLHAWGEVEEAKRVRERLAEAYPDSSWLHALDRKLARPPGTPPDEKIFVRPYRIRGLAGGAQGAPPQ